MKATPLTIVALAAVLLGAVGCASTPAAPFNTMQNGQVTVLHLQNNQPPPAAATGPAGGLSIPGMPPQLQSIITGAQQALPMIPGLGGLIPGLGGGAGAAPAPQATPTFQGYPIIKQNQLMDEDTRKKLAEIFGDADNFDNSGSPCMYPEMGVGWSGGGMQPNEMLVSFTCRQVEARTFAWPHPGRSMKQKTLDKLAALMPKLLP